MDGFTMGATFPPAGAGTVVASTSRSCAAGADPFWTGDAAETGLIAGIGYLHLEY
jgi:hypothetical protein